MQLQGVLLPDFWKFTVLGPDFPVAVIKIGTCSDLPKEKKAKMIPQRVELKA